VGAPEVRSPIFFETPAAFRAWLRAHHARGTDVWVGFHKRASGRPSLTWPESVDEALCVGWIDGIRRSIDVDRYAIRFTPRRRQSTWSAVNIKRAKELIRLGRMQPAGLRAFRARSDEQSAIYSYEQRRTARLARILHRAAAVVPAHRHLLGRQREATTDPRAAAGRADRRLRPWAHRPAADPSGPLIVSLRA
jgi:uncharacterized protein YdeI (YjbR/CyaY-like superfamily)